MNKKRGVIIVKNSTAGITLIALVVTIIVLIILAGISINLILGDNGIITKASQAREKNTHATVYESLQLELQAFSIEKNTGEISKTAVEYLTDKGIITQSAANEKEYIVNVEKLCGKKLEYGNGTDEQIDVYKLIEVTTVAKLASTEPVMVANTSNTEKIYILIYCGKNNGVTVTVGEVYVEIRVNENIPTEPSVTLTYDPPLSEYTNGSVVVTANTNTTGYTVEMSTDGINWDNIDSLSFTENGEVYARLVDGTTEVATAEGEVTNIDKTAPEAGTLRIYALIDGEYQEQTILEDSGVYYIENSQDTTYKFELVNGSDNESGHKKTTYSVSARVGSETENYENLTEPILFSKNGVEFLEENTTTMSDISTNNGEYQIIPVSSYIRVGIGLTVTTEDNAGNISTRRYVVNLAVEEL